MHKMINHRNKSILIGLFALGAAIPQAHAEQPSTSKNFKLTPQAATPAFTLPPVVANVNGTPIAVQEFWGRLMTNGGTQVLTGMVDEILIAQEASKSLSKGKAKEIDAEVAKRFGELKKQFQDEKTFITQLQNSGVKVDDIKHQIRTEVYKQKLLENQTKVSASEVKKYYDENKQSLAVPEQVHLKHILVASEKEARDFMTSLGVGANFEMLAKEKSLDAATKERGGDLGFFAKGMLIPELQEKAFALPAGGMDVVKTQLGYHIIKVIEKTPAKAAVWDKTTQTNVENILRQAKFNQAYPAYIQELRKKAKIEVNLNP